ncbi:MAG: DoxX family protein [Bacteroidota bacterium]|nr:DoxX family protein [Bacteroidota bacterium]
MTIQSTKAITMLQIIIGALIITHGALRIYSNTVLGFGEVLTLSGIPQGTIVAWSLTAFEILGGLTFLLGKFVKPIGLLLAIYLIAEIYLFQFKNGWSVSGFGKSEIEYNILLITSFFAVSLSQPKWK